MRIIYWHKSVGQIITTIKIIKMIFFGDEEFIFRNFWCGYTRTSCTRLFYQLFWNWLTWKEVEDRKCCCAQIVWCLFFVPWLCNQMIKGFESCHLANHVTLLPAADAIVVVHQTQAQHINSQQSRLLMDYLKGHKRKLWFRENLFWNTSTRFLTLETPLLTLHTAGFGSSLIASISSENYTVSNSYMVGLLVHYILVIIVSISVRTEKGNRVMFHIAVPFLVSLPGTFRTFLSGSFGVSWQFACRG